MSLPDTPLPVSSSGNEPGPDKTRGILLTSGAIVVVLIVIGLLTYNKGQDNSDAQAKAAQLTQKLQAAGLQAPVKQETLINWLGDDGGAVCDNPASALGKATLHSQLVNGASFVGQRPVIVDPRVLKGEALILETYCPEKLQEYKDQIDQLKTDSVLKD